MPLGPLMWYSLFISGRLLALVCETLPKLVIELSESRMWLILFVAMVARCAAEPPSNDIGVKKLEQVFAWKQLDYDLRPHTLKTRFTNTGNDASDDDAEVAFPEEEPDNPPDSPGNSEASSQDGSFIPYGNIPMGVDVWNDKVFIAVPRRRAGVPSTLNYVSLHENSGNKSPKLRPYPDLASNELSSPNPIVSVYRTRVDKCDRLWFVDTGILEIPGDTRSIHPPTIVIYDLKTNTLLRRYPLKPEDMIFDVQSGFASLTVDVTKDDCDSAYAYLPDLYNYGVVVYSLKEDTSWRISHNYFYFDPEEGDFNLNGLRFSWSDGVFSIALSAKGPDNFRTAYFHAMASFRERSVSTEVFRNISLAQRDNHNDDFKVLGSRGPASQTTLHAIHEKTGVMFSGQVGSNTLACWNTRKPFHQRNHGVVAKDAVEFMYPSDLKVIDDHVWVITNNLPKFIYSSLNPEEVNFRVYRVPVAHAIRGTVCN